MKTIKTIIFCTSILLTININAQSWQWAKKAGSLSLDDVQSICTDNNGDVYIVGQFGFINPTANYMLFDNDTVFNIGVNQIYLAKYSSSGSVLWVKGIGGNNPNLGGSTCSNCEYANRICYDSITNTLFMTGTIYGAVSFGSVNFTASNDLFLTNIDLNGNYIWTKLITSPVPVNNSAITTDLQSNIYIAGFSQDSISFDSITIPSGGYIAKYSQSGNCLWAKRKFIDASPSAILINGNIIYSCGRTINDTSMIDTLTLISNVANNMFFAKFNSNFDIMWIKQGSSSAGSGANGMSTDVTGNVYLTGGFQSNINFGIVNLTNSNFNDIFFAMYDSNGVFQWAKQSSTTFTAGVFSPITLNDGITYIVGNYSGNVTFGSFNLNTLNSSQVFFARYNNKGDCISAFDFGQASCHGISFDAFNNFYVTGTFNSAFNLDNTTLTPYFATDVFIAKHNLITGIGGHERHANNQLIIYANPTAGKCNITVPDDFLHEKNLTLSIYANDGKLIQQKNLQTSPLGGQGAIRLNLEAEAKGIYTITLSNGVKNYSGKIVFE